ncbi:unnamed protein product [Ceratitis capitata]|uniref:(Mediterranean fruit fly) hypothetical protein n=1 Tax=Ceratitis capitata TaxID=7213 RepID=A0A811V4U8_CERCA|nr:unnamed protein product [Ceratitis capitata]
MDSVLQKHTLSSAPVINTVQQIEVQKFIAICWNDSLKVLLCVLKVVRCGAHMRVNSIPFQFNRQKRKNASIVWFD